MTLADFFVAVNSAGIRLANVVGQLQLRGPTNTITAEIKAGAAKHKATILAMLPLATVSATESAEIGIPQTLLSDPTERAKAIAELPAENVARKQSAVAERGNGHDWQDWRLEWLMEVGRLFLRMRSCQDQVALSHLIPLAEARPSSREEWLALGQQIADTEHELRHQGKLPNYPWPERDAP